MPTILTEPIDQTQTIVEQRVDKILMNMKAGEIEVHIGDYAGSLVVGVDENGIDISAFVDPIQTNSFFQKFEDMPEGEAKDNFRAVLDSVMAYARSIDMIGAGTDSNPI